MFSIIYGECHTFLLLSREKGSPARVEGLLKTPRQFSYVGASPVCAPNQCVVLSFGQTHRSAPTTKPETSAPDITACLSTFFVQRQISLAGIDFGKETLAVDNKTNVSSLPYHPFASLASTSKSSFRPSTATSTAVADISAPIPDGFI